MDLLRRELAFQGTESGFRVILKRNCSISPAALLRVFALVALVSIGIGAGFAVAGAWMILPFAGFEVVALGIAFLLNGRRAADYERIELVRDGLTVEIAEAERVARYEFAARETRVGYGRDARVVLSDRERMVEVGRHLDAQARAGLGAELAKRLKS
jgi:uncharacterized membrane protein